MYVCMRTNKSTESTLGLYRRMWCSMQSSKVVSFPGLGKTSEEKDVEERERERGTFLLPGVLRLTFWFRWSLNDFMSLKFWMGESSSGFFHICSGKTEEMSRGENFKGSQKDNFRLWALRSWKEPEAFSIWKETQQKRGNQHKNPRLFSSFLAKHSLADFFKGENESQHTGPGSCLCFRLMSQQSSRKVDPEPS